jgi:CRP-like cAMP-binding protein
LTATRGLRVTVERRALDEVGRRHLGPGDFFGEMTLIEMQNRSATVVAESPTVLYQLTARNLYAYYRADISAYVMVILNINRELCRRLRRADNRIAELGDVSPE